jgi:D-Tyr-tRNAtyr deacylase
MLSPRCPSRASVGSSGHMEVELVNDGPVTLWIDAAEL